MIQFWSPVLAGTIIGAAALCMGFGAIWVAAMGTAGALAQGLYVADDYAHVKDVLRDLRHARVGTPALDAAVQGIVAVEGAQLGLVDEHDSLLGETVPWTTDLRDQDRLPGTWACVKVPIPYSPPKWAVVLEVPTPEGRLRVKGIATTVPLARSLALVSAIMELHQRRYLG